jgi:hypothetical protein
MAGHFMVSNLYNLAISIKTFNRMHVLVVVHASNLNRVLYNEIVCENNMEIIEIRDYM